MAGTTAYLAGRDVRAYDIGALRTCVTTAAACAPSWSFTPDPALTDVGVTHLAVNGGRAFAAVSRPAGVGTTRIASLDDDGQVGCSGTPKVCTEQWTTDPVAGLAVDVATVGSTVILAFSPRAGSVPGPGQDGDLVVYDIESCADAVTGCPDYWRAATMVAPSRIAIGEQYIYVGNDAGADRVIEAYDRIGSPCTGFMPELCTPRIRFEDPGADVGGTPVVASTHLFVGGRAFDYEGADGCDGSSPEHCESLRPDGASGEAIVLNGRVHWVDATDPAHLVLRTDQVPA